MIRAKSIALLALSSACMTSLTMAEEAPWNRHDWGSLESSRALYRPAMRIHIKEGEINFLASELRYAFDSQTGVWEVTPSGTQEPYFEGWGMVAGANEVATPSGKLTVSQIGPGELAMNWLACSPTSGPVRLWTAADIGRVWLKDMQQRMRPRPKTAEDLVKWITVSEPQVMAWEEDHQSLWLGIGFYAGEGSLGIGTVVQLEKAACRFNIHQPPSLGTSSIMHMKLWKGDLWLATGHFAESGWGTKMGLVRFDPRSAQVESFPKVNPLADAFVTAMAREKSTLWIATPGRFFALNMDTRGLRSWRIVPRLELKTPRAVSSRPGGLERSKLRAGNYEVRWLGPNFVEVPTPDCETGYVEKGWLPDPRMKGTADLDEIAASTKWGNPSSLRLYQTPVDLRARPTPQGWFLRVPVVGIGSPKDEWQRARVCAGWVEARPEDVRLFVERVR